MSLINDALKKTQRLRADPDDNGAPAVAYGMPPRGGRGNSGPSVTLLVVAALVLVIVAVGGTLLILRSKSAPNSVAATKPIETQPIASVVSAPVIVAASSPTASAAAPIIVAPALTLAKAPGVPAAPALTAAPTSPEQAASAPPPTSATKSAPSKLDIGNFIDAIHVTGVRFSEGSSKVLMNDKVYKVNDVVDRTLNIKLIEVKNDSLTFVDETGTVYKKSF